MAGVGTAQKGDEVQVREYSTKDLGPFLQGKGERDSLRQGSLRREIDDSIFWAIQKACSLHNTVTLSIKAEGQNTGLLLLNGLLRSP